MKTTIAKDIERAGIMVQYDAQCKRVLSNKYILAWIMKTVMPDYGEIKKVYSIWICCNAPQYIGNALTLYNIQKTDIVGSASEFKENYDKMCVAMIYLNSKVSRRRGFFDMMNTLLSPEIEVETKKRILGNEYQIPMERGLVKEVEFMCNLSQGVLELGIERGIEQEKRKFCAYYNDWQTYIHKIKDLNNVRVCDFLNRIP